MFLSASVALVRVGCAAGYLVDEMQVRSLYSKVAFGLWSVDKRTGDEPIYIEKVS